MKLWCVSAVTILVLLASSFHYSSSSESTALAKGSYDLSDLSEAEIKTVNEQKGESSIRTATGGPIKRILIFLTIIAFGGNGAFLCYVFWLSK